MFIANIGHYFAFEALIKEQVSIHSKQVQSICRLCRFIVAIHTFITDEKHQWTNLVWELSGELTALIFVTSTRTILHMNIRFSWNKPRNALLLTLAMCAYRGFIRLAHHQRESWHRLPVWTVSSASSKRHYKMTMRVFCECGDWCPHWFADAATPPLTQSHALVMQPVYLTHIRREANCNWITRWRRRWRRHVTQ